MKINLSGHENQALKEQGFVFPGTIQVDLAQDSLQLITKLVELLKGLGVKTDSVVTLALPGLSGLAMAVVIACHGLTGNFPYIQPLVRQTDGTFQPSVEVWDSEKLRNNVTRTMRDNIIIM